MRKVLPLIALALLVACSRGSVEVENGTVLEKRQFPTVMKQGKELIDPVHGKQKSFAYGAVNGSEGVNANGVAFVHGFSDGTSVAIVNLNIEPAARGTAYIAWLQSGKGSVVKVGVLTNPLGDVRHTVRLESRENFSEDLSVTVTKEASAAVIKPVGVVVSEGTLKKVK